MAEWFVDPDNGLTTNSGTLLSPWKLIPGQTGSAGQTGYTVTAGDTINIKNGSRSALSVNVPADNLTYRGYGLGGNVLQLVLPDGPFKVVVPVYRQRGVHEGMWILDDGVVGTFGVFRTGSRSGTVVEDLHIIAPASSTALSLGTSGVTAIGATVRRSWVQGSASNGLDAYARQVTIEDTRIEDCQDDGITLGASLVNGYRAGYGDRFERLSIINVGLDFAGFTGDAIQVFASSDRYESPLTIRDLYVYKPNTVKQGLVFSDMLGGLTLERFLLEGPEQACVQILLSGLRGNALIRQGVLNGGTWFHPAVRTVGQSGISMATGSKITIESVMLLSPVNNGLFAWGGTETAATVDGEVVIQNCYAAGESQAALSYSGVISCAGSGAGGITINANAKLTARNNIILTTGAGSPAIRLPTGGGGAAAWTIRNNLFAHGLGFAIGSTPYADLAAFVAAHPSTANKQEAPVLSSAFRPLPGSPCIGAGEFIPGVRHMNGQPLRVPADIGAYAYEPPRSVALFRP